MRLLIDEMYPPAVAGQLRKAGYDVVSVCEDLTLRGLDDTAICEAAIAARRAVVTENAADFLRIVRNWATGCERAPALVITANWSFSRHTDSFLGQAVRALGSFCQEHQAADVSAGAVYWLRPV